MAKRVTKSTLARVKARKAAKSLVEPENKPIAKGDPRAWDFEISKELLTGEAEPKPPEMTYMQSTPDQWPGNGKPNWPLAGAIAFCLVFWLVVMWYFFG